MTALTPLVARCARYSEGMTIARIQSIVAGAFVLLLAGAGHADDKTKTNEAEAEARRVGADVRGWFAPFPEADITPALQGATALAAGAAQGFSGPSGMRIELFGRGGLSLLNVTAEDSIAISAGPESADESISATRLVSEVGWGGGARLMSGDWGVEGTYSIFESFALSPSWLVTDENAGPDIQTGLLDQPFVASRANLLLGQLVRTFRLSNSAELSVGVGAGWLRVTDSTTDRLLAGVSFPAPDEITGEIPPELPPEFVDAFVPEVEFTADRTSIAYAGSLGLAFRYGRMILRPRADVIISRALTTDLTVGFPDLGELAPEDLEGFDFTYGTSVKPTIFLISLDIGFSN